MKRTPLRRLALICVVAGAAMSAQAAHAADMYWRYGPDFLVPAPYTYDYGMVGSPPPYYIYDPAPVVYYPAPAAGAYVETIPVGSYRYRYKFSMQPDYRYSYRHGRLTYEVEGRDPSGGELRYRYRFNRGRVKAKLRYRYR